MIIPATHQYFKDILEIINDASMAYKGIIPADRWHEPYMSQEELRRQMSDNIEFWCYVDRDAIVGVMGIQDKGDVTLIRHAYVRTTARKGGIGSKLLHHLTELTSKPVLIGTWAAATWAINFYTKHGFQLVSPANTEKLLKKYWDIPLRQIETSVVLASSDWFENQK